MAFLLSFTAALALAFALPNDNPLASISAPSVANPTVTIDAGIVAGTITALPKATAPINKFLGIPFGDSPPVRFGKPLPPKKWTGVRQAVTNKPACVQQFNYPEASRNQTMTVFNNPPPQESEDCLYLNVWAPRSAPPEGWPVMLWLYGGAFIFGSGGLPGYDGTNFASNENIVLVTMNYRTNVFGFPASPELPLAERNLGLLDQRAVLAWIQKNIKAFGGDPEKVTIFGESAGGASVDALLTGYGAGEKPPFRAGIMQSGQISVGGRMGRGDQNSSAWDALVKGLNCSSTASALACVRAAPALKVKEVVERGALSFGPQVDNATLYAGAGERRTQGLIPKLPVMIGSNAQESKINVRGMNDLAGYIAKTFPGNTTKQALVAAAYAVGKEFQTANDAIAQISTDMGAGCGTYKYSLAAAAAGHPTFWYYYNASFPNIQPFPGSGVYHASEIDMVFGTYGHTGATYSGPASTSQQIALSNYMTGAWAAFARNPQRGPGWPAVGSIAEDVGVLGPAGTSGVHMVPWQRVAGKCHLFD